MRNTAPSPAILLLPLLLSACGGGHDSAPQQTAVATQASAPILPLPASGEAGVTGIDASTGDARAMPADWNGPSAYDLAQRKAADRARTSAKAPAEPRHAAIETRGVDLLGSDETLTTGG